MAPSTLNEPVAKVGITTSQADAIVANSSNIIAISFFSDCNNLTGIGSAPINLIDVDLGDNILTGFPILPSGAGAFYNNFGAAIDVPAPVPTSGRGYTYGEYMPYDGEIVGAAINLTSKSATGNPEPLASKYPIPLSEPKSVPVEEVILDIEEHGEFIRISSTNSVTVYCVILLVIGGGIE